jgi:hypothetical protein
MKTLFATSVILASVLSAAAEAAVVAPVVGSRGSYSRSFNSSRSFNGYTSNRSYNAMLNASDGSIYGTAASSFNNPFGSGSSNEQFSGSIDSGGLFNGGGRNQSVNGAAFPLTAGPYSAGLVSPDGAYVPALYGDAGGEVDNGGPPETPESTMLKGKANVISAAGKYNRDTAAAAVNATEAESKAMKNAVDRVGTYYAVREAGRVAREKERGPRPDAEELTRRAVAAAPRNLNTNQIDPVSGELHWPSFLQEARFESQRTAISDCAMNWVRYGELTYDQQTRIRENIGTMFESLQSQVDVMPPQDYVACRSFLNSLLYATTHTVLQAA